MKIKETYNKITEPLNSKYTLGGVIFVTLIISSLLGTHEKYGALVSAILVVFVYAVVSLIVIAGVKIFGKDKTNQGSGK